MKLAEALMLRAELQSRLHALRRRMSRNAIVQEGESPAEDPAELIAEFEEMTAQLVNTIRAINRTNTATMVDDEHTLSDLLAERDVLKLKQSTYRELAETGSHQQFRYSRSEVRHVSTIDVARMQSTADRYGREHREIDTRIQEINWTTELVE